jgi:hypothetical protein
MPLTLSDLKIYGSATMPDDNTTTNIGGAIDKAKKVDFTDNTGGTFQAVSSSSADTTQTMTITGRNSVGSFTTEAKTLSGTSPVLFVTSWERLLKTVKSATTGGWSAIEAQVAERQNTAQGGSVNTIQFDVGASAVDDFYNAMVVRLISGTGREQIREVVSYVGSTKTATLNWPWNPAIGLPDATTVFRISRGLIFDKAPNETTQVRRVFYDAAANAPGGGQIDFYDKVFAHNSSDTLALLTAQVSIPLDPTNRINFALGAINGTQTNGGGNNRNVNFSGVVGYGTSPVTVSGTDLLAGSSVEVFLRLRLPDGDVAQKNAFVLMLAGSTI